MFKKTMTFEDLDGNEVTKSFYFNYNKKELAELLEFGGLEEKLKKLQTPVEESGLTEQENTKQAYDIFQDLLLDAYGEKSEDNLSFDKSPEKRKYWSNHVAFVELIFEFIANPNEAIVFMEACFPQKMLAAAKDDIQKEHKGLTSTTLSEMVQEAERRQKDPATRIEPGPEAAAAALGENKEVAQLATAVKDGQEPAKKPEDLTVEDVRAMDDVAFAKLKPQNLSREAMLAAFERKSKD